MVRKPSKPRRRNPFRRVAYDTAEAALLAKSYWVRDTERRLKERDMHLNKGEAFEDLDVKRPEKK